VRTIPRDELVQSHRGPIQLVKDRKVAGAGVLVVVAAAAAAGMLSLSSLQKGE